MEINFHTKTLDASSTSFVSRLKGREAKTTQDEIAFENSRALATALQDTSVVRDDIVRRATELVGDVNYPPPETIRMISHLLAIQRHPEG